MGVGARAALGVGGGAPVEEVGVVSKLLLFLTVFFYLVAFLLTSSRAFIGLSEPAVMDGPGYPYGTDMPYGYVADEGATIPPVLETDVFPGIAVE